MTGAFWDDLSGDARDPEFVRAYADDAIRINRIDSLVNAQHDADGTANVPAILSEMSSTTAARVLGIARPALIKLVSDGLLPSHKVGAHHRFTHADVAKLAEVRRAERSGAFDKLRELDEALEKPGDGDDTKHS